MATSTSVQNNFIGGLKTEFTGLNFPENAATDTDNCVYNIVGDVSRREGFNYETNFKLNSIDRTEKAISDYKWNNAGGDGETQIFVQQVGSMLYFYLITAATTTSPLSQQLLTSTVNLATFLPMGSTNDPSTLECQFSDGNGYLFVFHPYLDSIFCSYVSGVISSQIIPISIRDFSGINEPGVDINNRPTSLNIEHSYNLSNQGWTSGNSWSTVSLSFAGGLTTGVKTFSVQAGLTISNGQRVKITGVGTSQPGSNYYSFGPMSGSVVSYSGTTLVISVDTVTGSLPNSVTFDYWVLFPANAGLINTWLTAIGLYPSNADVWWNFKDSTDIFNPGVTFGNVTSSTGPAPKGHYIVKAFNIDRSAISSIFGISVVDTFLRPKTGTWFQGRVWYAGVDGSQPANGDAAYYTWTENIYFSQTAVDQTQFGLCYQTNDPTSEDLFGLLPTDGGVITIQGCGAIYKLFPIQNGLLVFAANGIWFITGSQGIGFAANDYTITKISSVESIAGTSYINVQGLPYFWNEDGIYTVQPAQQGLGMTVEPITVGTIESFYDDIPLMSKKYVRGDYHPIDYTIQWTYRSTNETDITSRYQFDRILNYNVYIKSFFPYTLQGVPFIHGVRYVQGPGGSTSPSPSFKYQTSQFSSGSYSFTFSEENDDSYLDFKSFDGIGEDPPSYFITGFSLKGKGLLRYQPSYIYMYSNNTEPTQYKIQGLWDYANNRSSGRWTNTQLIQNNDQYSDVVFRKHKIRGAGMALQLKVSSVPGQKFDIIGWTSWDVANPSI